ncbi:MAG TPA: hypothetical protein VLA52_12880 [Thermohalobaculum sp.]|nr:hypothetical protein [Thermohalobaculum sp.]
MRLAAAGAMLALAALAAGCQTDPAAQDEAPQAEAAPNAGQPADPALAALPPPQPGAAPTARLMPPPGPSTQPAPHIYMALQDEGPGKPVSVVFAIDAARDRTPSDDPAVRLTPEAGLCNPQEMTRYEFPPDAAAQPVFADAERAAGVGANDLPAYLAVAVTDNMLARGLAATPEDTRPQNVCTRKLWEQLVLAENLPPTPEPVPAGQ